MPFNLAATQGTTRFQLIAFCTSASDLTPHPAPALQVTLEAGPAAVLAVAEPQPLCTGLRAVLPLLRVHITDAQGNAAKCPNCEVCKLCPPPSTILFWLGSTSVAIV